MPKRREDPHAQHAGLTAAEIAQTAGPLAEHAQAAAATVDPAAIYQLSDWDGSSLWKPAIGGRFKIDARTLETYFLGQARYD